MVKRPSFQFYPGDWWRDLGLRSCSVAARGLWIDMICLMHEGTPYGYMKVGEKVILPVNLAAMVGLTLPEVERLLEELRVAKVFSISEDGTYFSRRMVRDEDLRAKRAAGGSCGGNPKLKVNHKDNLEDNLQPQNKVKQKPTPSSSSSSSSSFLNTHTHAAPTIEQLKEAGIPPEFLSPEGMVAIQKWHDHCASYHKRKGVVQIQAEIAEAIRHGWSPAKWMSAVVFSIAKSAINIIDPDDDWTKKRNKPAAKTAKEQMEQIEELYG